MKLIRIYTYLFFIAVFIYSGAVSAGTEGTNNTFYGNSAGSKISTGGTYNSFLGAFAGYENTNGDPILKDVDRIYKINIRNV